MMINDGWAHSASSLTHEEAYQLGHDYVVHGADQANCRFSIFSNPESAVAWEEGRLDAEREARGMQLASAGW